jgi:WD40 repeat protein
VDVFTRITTVDTPDIKSLDRVIDLMMLQLSENENSRAFDGYDVNWNEEIDTVTCLHTLRLPGRIREKLKYNPLSCTDISWNSVGNIIAASYGRLNHVGWCLESGYVALWNIYDIESPEQPNVIEVEESYVMKIAFHTKNPNILAIGTYDGGIKIYTIQNDSNSDSLIASSEISNYSHRDAITALVWLDHRREKTLLCSMGGDGKVLLWDTENNLAKPVASYFFTYPNRNAALGGSCLSFINVHAGTNLSKKYTASTDSHFLIGTQIGEVYKAIFSTSNLIEAKDSKNSQTNKVEGIKTRHNPIEFSFNTSIGYIYNIDPYPFDKNIFLTCSSDGIIRLYNIHQKNENMIIQPSTEGQFIYDARWSPFKPQVISCVSNNGRLFIYDLNHSTSEPAVNIVASEDNSAVNIVRFSEKFHQYLVTGDTKGIIKLWQLNDSLSKPKGNHI